MNTTKRSVFLLLLVGLFSLYAVSAQPYGGNVTAGASSRFNESGFAPTIAYAQAGNVTQLSINGTAITTSWQGFYGNVTGTLILGDANGDQFYTWGNMSSPSGEVYASRSNSVTWATINCSTAANITVEETYLGQAAADPDSVTNTYTLTTHPDFFVGSANVSGCYSTKANNATGEQGTGFWQVLLNDETSTVYTTILDNTPETGFNNLPWDFQLLVGENGKNNEVATPYYFYVELQ
jgi:hypothetical protein